MPNEKSPDTPISIEEVLSRLKQNETLEDIIGKDYREYRANNLELALPKIPSNFTIGIEIEMYSTLSRMAIMERLRSIGLDSWNVGLDGSINPRLIKDEFSINTSLSSMELTSPILRGDQVWIQMQSICNLLSTTHEGKAIGQVNPSCGLHFHIGVGGLSDQVKRRIVQLFKLCWPKLESITPDHRLDNYYCRPLTTNATYDSLLNTAKYKALNINTRYPTFEYRFPCGTRNYYVMYCTCLALVNIHQYAIEGIMKQDENFYDIVKVPILWDFFTRRNRWLIQNGNVDKKEKDSRKLFKLNTNTRNDGTREINRPENIWSFEPVEEVSW